MGLNRAHSTKSAEQHYLCQSRYVPGVNPRSLYSSVGSQAAGKNQSCFMLTRTHGLHIHRATDSFQINPKTFEYPLQKAEIGADRQKIILAPIEVTSAVDLSPTADLRTDHKTKTSASRPHLNQASSSNEELEGWRSRSLHAQILGPSAIGRSGPSRSTNLQPVHGRVDSTAKYGGYR
ncbi:hypothetical protein CHARACLAT_020539 [Characodon lateralis]|uniref:Uncharacterized protein n=1 Tax=Characodon lateralis TaxID=208331 RepID=A0ABU7CZB8_9TELE|nr:hypothetical protein [Characodon lateralis]